MRTYTTLVNNVILYRGADYEEARHAWNSESWSKTYTDNTECCGGIAVQDFNSDGVVVRDGWIMCKESNGHVYLGRI